MKKIKVKRGQSFRSKLLRMRACEEGRRWVGSKSLRSFWATCPRGDWMLWLAFRAKIKPRLIVGTACKCARLVIGRVLKTTPSPLKAIELGERFASGERINNVRLHRVYYLAKEDADRQMTMVARDAALAAAYASLSGLDAECGWLTCCQVADVFQGTGEGTPTWLDAQKKCADIVRKHIPFAVIEKAMKGVK